MKRDSMITAAVAVSRNAAVDSMVSMCKTLYGDSKVGKAAMAKIEKLRKPSA